MRLSVLEDSTIQIEEVFSGISLKTKDGEVMSICMKDSGFEFNYQGKWYFAKEGYVEPFHKSVRDSYLVSRLQKHDSNLDEIAKVREDINEFKKYQITLYECPKIDDNNEK